VTLESYFEFLDTGDGIRVKGRRVGIDLILERFKAGKTPVQIAEEFDTIRLEDVYATITYYLHDQNTLDAWLDSITATLQQDMAEWNAHPAPVVERLRARAQDQQVKKPTRQEQQLSA
jgi:alpha-D-ribose 1-methylphosphonate 5-triphosphate synthase subunit PhnG